MGKAKNSGAGSPEPGNDGAIVGAGSGDGGNESGAGTIAGIPVSDPASVTDTGNAGGNPGNESTEPAKRRRGRPAGSGKSSGSREKPAAPTVTGIEKLLYGIHAGLASATGAAEMQLSRDESALMASSIAEVASHYDTTVDPKTMAWVGLFGVLGSIYGPRVAAMRIRKKMEKSSAKRVDPLPSGPVGPIMTGVPGFDPNQTAH